jgi:hypothetical protein
MNSDLQTLALQYALDELAGEDALAFECRLETDQSAREALADAVLLTAALRQLPRATRFQAAPRKPSSRRSAIAVVGTCAAACLLFVVLIRLPQTGRSVAQRPGFEATAIVGTWSEMEVDPMLLSEMDAELMRYDASAEIPDWMVAAVLEDVEATPRREGPL